MGLAVFCLKIGRPDHEMQPIHSKAMQRWHTSMRHIRSKKLKRDFDLRHEARIFDDVFFCASLRKRMTVRWAEGSVDEVGWDGRTTLAPDDKGRRRVKIEIAKPTDQYWTDATVQEILNALLREMVDSSFLLRSCVCSSCQRQMMEVMKFRKAGGPDPSVAKLREAVEKIANHFLAGFNDLWRL